MALSFVNKKGLGWKPDLPDFRDLKYAGRMALEATALPPKVDLRSGFPVPPYDQGQLGSCVANGIAALVQYDRAKQKLPQFMPSRLFIYYNARVIDGDVPQDNGTQIRTGIQVISKYGFAHETIWPYDISKFADKPVAEAFKDARRYYAVQYYRINNQDINQLKTCLAAGYPIVFGATIYNNFENGDTNGGYVPMPSGSVDGGHCMLMVGYDDSTNHFIIRNSWGTDVGDGGYYYIPYQYLTDDNLADDFWTVRSVSSEYKDKWL